MNDFYQKIRRRFCEIMDWHPVDGDSDKPVSMSLNQFILATREKGVDWWMWEFFDPHLLSEREMIDEIEYIDGMVMYERQGEPPKLRIHSGAIKLKDPVYRIAKINTKSGSHRVVRQYHLPPGNQFDKRITKSKALKAYEMIKNGSGVKSALDHYGVKWNALVKYTDYVPVRKVLKREALRKCVELISDGMKMREALNHTGISYTSLYKWSGGLRSLHNTQIKSTTQSVNLEWGINVTSST